MVTPLLPRYRIPSRSAEHQVFLGHHYPGTRRGEQADPGHDSYHPPHQAHHGDIDVEVFGDAGADAGDGPPHARTNQALAGNYAAHADSAVSADIGIVLNNFPAIVTVHGDGSSR